ncbi:MAG: hypothetical protein R2817_02685 [Flavobacteriales bacterium]
MCRSASILLALLPILMHAQSDTSGSPPQLRTIKIQVGPSFLTTQDSIGFTRFIQENVLPEMTVEPFVFEADFRLVWHERNYPGHWSVVRGDGRTLQAFMTDPPVQCPPLACVPQPLGIGRMVIVHDPPMGMYQIDRWYFVAE